MGNIQCHNPKKITAHGFTFDSSHSMLANWILETYPESIKNVHVQNQKLRTTYMNLLCRTIKTLYHKPLCNLNETELSKAFKDFSDLTQAGFNLDWLESKLEKITMEKKNSEARVKEIKEEFTKLKLKISDLKVEKKSEKAKLKNKPCWIQGQTEEQTMLETICLG